MRKIVLGLAVSLDGFIEGPNGEYDWCFTDQDYGLNDFMKSIDTVLMGRKSYDISIQYGESPWKGMKTYVFSRKGIPHLQNNADVVNSLDAINEIRKQPGKDLWLFGGADLTTQFLNAGMIDELWLSIHPILLGAGKPLFQNLDGRKNLKLIETKTYDTGLVSVRYSQNLKSKI